MVLAIRLNDFELIKSDFNDAPDPALKKQLGFLIGRQRIWLDYPLETTRTTRRLWIRSET